jgi:hypothetical protein
MTRSRISHARLSRNLGSRVSGHVQAGGGYFGALHVAEEVRRRFKAAPGGGRARDPKWTQKRLLPVRPETLARLQDLAARISEIVEFHVGPLQVAAVLVERDLGRLDDREVVEAVTSAARKRA